MRKVIESFPPVVKFFFAASLSMIFIGLLFFGGLLLGSIVFDSSVAGFLQRTSHPEFIDNIPTIRYILALQTAVIFTTPILVFSYVFRGGFTKTLMLSGKIDMRLLIYTVTIILVAFPFINFLADFNGQVIDGVLGADNSLKAREKEAENIVKGLVGSLSITSLTVNILVMALLPALCEELFFRGFLQNFLLRSVKNIHVAIFFSGFIFSFIHFQFYGFIPRLLLGMFFGYLLVWGGSLWIPIVAHFLNNLIAVIGLSLVNHQKLPSEIENLGSSDSIIFAGLISGLIVCYIIFRLFEKYQPVGLKHIVK